MRRRIWFRVHSWIGVITGLLLFVVCWSGTVATLSNEIDWLLTPQLRVEPAGKALSLARVHASVAAVYPQASIDRIHAPLGPRYAAQAIVELRDQRYVRVHLNTYTAEILGSSSYFNVQRFFRSFHMMLFNGKLGYYIVWVLSVPFLVSLLSPLVFYRRWWRRFFDFRTGRGTRVFWSDAHKVAGLWSLAFAFIIALTSVWYLFEAVRLDVLDGKFSWVGTDETAVNRLPALPPGKPLPLEELLARAKQARPDLDVKTLSLGPSGYFHVDGQGDEWLLRDRANKLYLDAREGSVAFNQRASELSLYWRWSDTADPLHFGNFAGLASKLLWFFFGLVVSGLCLTGAYLHAKRLQSETGARARWPGMLAALVASGLVLAGSVWGGWVEIKAYGPVVNGVQQWPDVPLAVSAFIALWVALTLAVLGWWATLLWTRAGSSGTAVASRQPYRHTEKSSHFVAQPASPPGEPAKAVKKAQA